MSIDLPRLPTRSNDAHKGDFGRALLVGGSPGLSGAIGLAGMATLRAGAGLVTLATSSACLPVVASFEPCYMTAALPSDEDGRISLDARDQIAELAATATCVAIGPGLGQSPGLIDLVEWLYQSLEQPMVIDADGLNALARRPQTLSDPAGPRVLTPHPGEFRRLVGETAQNRAAQESQAVDLAGKSGAVIVLKGHHTFVTDGKVKLHNSTGNPGMATGGSGDVLTGVITALICQSLKPREAAHLGVYLHGLAGDLAVERLGQRSLIARDLIEYLHAAFQAYGH